MPSVTVNMADDLGNQVPQDAATSSITIVRIKRRREDPAEPEIILEAAGYQCNKQPRYYEVLLQFQGLSVVGAGAIRAEAPRRRFRRLRTMDVSVLEGMSETELMRLLRAQSGTEASTSAAGAATVATTPSALPAEFNAFQGQIGPDDSAILQRRPARLTPGPSQENRLAALRMSHRQSGAMARFKQIRRKRESIFGEAAAAAASLFHMYDLERLPGGNAAGQAQASGSPSGRRQHMGSRRSLQGSGRQQIGLQLRAKDRQEQRQQQQAQQLGELPLPGPAQVHAIREQQQEQQRSAAPGAAGATAGGTASGTSDEAALIQQLYAPLVEEYLHSLGVQQQQEQHQAVRRIPARPRHHAAPQPPVQQQQQPHTQLWTPALQDADQAQQQEPAVAASPQPPLGSPGDPGVPSNGLAAAPALGVPSAGATKMVGVVAPEDEVGKGPAGPVGPGEEGDAFVYDVYVPVSDGEEDGGDCGKWLDAPSAVDLAVPVIEVGEDDDEFFWAGQLEAEAAQRAAIADEHDSEDSNAESYFANSYPDEEDAPYGNDAATEESDDDDEEDGDEDLADADAADGSWGGGENLRRGRGPGALSDDDEDAEDGGDEEDEEIFGRRRHRRARQPLRSSYYRREDDDYSEHSSFLSEEEERREAEERRHRSIFMH